MSSSFVVLAAVEPGTGGESMPFARLLLKLEVALECPGGWYLDFGLDECDRTEFTEFVLRLGALLSSGDTGLEFCLLGRRTGLIPLDWMESLPRAGGEGVRAGRELELDDAEAKLGPLVIWGDQVVAGVGSYTGDVTRCSTVVVADAAPQRRRNSFIGALS